MRHDPLAMEREEVAELLAFVAEAHEVATTLEWQEQPELAERLRAVADEQARRLPSLGRYLKSVAHVYAERSA